MESETNSMPPVIGVKWWPRLSALFSMITLIIQILNWQFFTMATWIPAFLIGEPGNYISLIFSILAFGCLILDVDVPGKFGKQLEKISELREIGIEKLRKCRGWVLACYTSANIMGGMLIDQITVGFDLLKFGFLVLAFSIMVATLNKFKALIRGTENIELVSQVDASYMMGFIFSLVLGLGGEFYLSTWIFIVNLIRVLQKKEKRSEKINDIEYWDKVISIEFEDRLKKVISGIMLFDLIIFFMFFKDFQDLLPIVIAEPVALIAPLIFISFVLLTYLLNSIDFSKFESFSFKKGYFTLVIIKFLLLIIVYITIPYTRSTCRFSNYADPAILDVATLLFAAALVSPLLTLILPISNLAENAKNDKDLPKFRRYYILNAIGTIFLMVLMIVVFALALPNYFFVMIISATGILFPLIILYEIPNYNSYMRDIIPKEQEVYLINAKKIFCLSIITVPVAFIWLYNLEYIAFLTPHLRYAIFSVPMLITVLILSLIGFFFMRTKIELVILVVNCGFLSTGSWGFIFFLGGLDIVQFLSSFIITGIGCIILGFILSKIKKETVNQKSQA